LIDINLLIIVKRLKATRKATVCYQERP